MKRQACYRQSNHAAMSGSGFTINRQAKDLWKAEGAPDAKACAARGQVIEGTRKFLSLRAKLNDAASVHVCPRPSGIRDD